MLGIVHHIVFDARFAGQTVGLGSYSRGLAVALASLETSVHWTFLVRSLDEAWQHPLEGRAHVSFVHAPWKHYSYEEQCFLPRLIRSTGATFAYFPHFNVPLRCPVPFACTIHDLILHRYPGNVSCLRQWCYRCVMRRSIARAAHIVAPSHAVCEDLLQVYGTRIHSISVLYPGIDAAYVPPTPGAVDALRTRHGLPEKYFLYVGNRRAHKNVDTLIAGFVAAHLDDCSLVLVSPRDPAQDASLPPSCRVLHDIDSNDMATLYGGACACVTATKAEGFCLPLLEAMRSGCPVLCSDIPPLPEVTGGHAFFFSPTIEGVAMALRHSIDSPPHASARDAARRYALRFTWETAAEKLLAVLRTLGAC